MAGETDLAVLLRSMRPVLRPSTYVFITIPAREAAPAGLSPVMSFREEEGQTLIVPQEEAVAAGVDATFPCRMITLRIHSALDAVGFLAAVLVPLAAAGIPVNPVSAFFHDHLFVPAARAEEAVRILEELART